MPLPPNLDLIDLEILRAIHVRRETSAREIQRAVFLSRSQVLRRLGILEQQGLVTKRNGTPGRTYFFTLTSLVTLPDLEETDRERLERAAIARSLASQELRSIINRIRDVVRQLEEERIN
jgi:DNA-binding transcriptional ArsR family regulator